jgi:hypothetical protein
VAGYEPNAVYAAAARDRTASVAGALIVSGGFLDLDEEAAFELICAIIPGAISEEVIEDEHRYAITTYAELEARSTTRGCRS